MCAQVLVEQKNVDRGVGNWELEQGMAAAREVNDEHALWQKAGHEGVVVSGRRSKNSWCSRRRPACSPARGLVAGLTSWRFPSMLFHEHLLGRDRLRRGRHLPEALGAPAPAEQPAPARTSRSLVSSVDFTRDAALASTGPSRLAAASESDKLDHVEVCEEGLRVGFYDTFVEDVNCPGKWTVAFALPWRARRSARRRVMRAARGFTLAVAVAASSAVGDEAGFGGLQAPAADDGCVIQDDHGIWRSCD